MSHPNGPRTGRPPTYAPRGVVSTPHYLASAAGLNMLERGGSAVDAAIAANAVLCVVYPHMAGLGGDGFWLIAEPGPARCMGSTLVDRLRASPRSITTARGARTTKFLRAAR